MTRTLNHLSALLPALALMACQPETSTPSDERSDEVTDTTSEVTDTTSDLPDIDALVFADAVSLTDVPVYDEAPFFSDLDGDGHIDLLYTSDGRIGWLRGDGTGSLEVASTAAIHSAADALAVRGAEQLGFANMEQNLYTVSALSTPTGDHLLVQMTLSAPQGQDDWGVVSGILSPDTSGGWSATLLATSTHWGSLVPLADIDGDGFGEILLDIDDTVMVAWGGSPDDIEVIGTTTHSSIYPAAWTTDVHGDGSLGFVLACNWGFGFSEMWSWTPDQGLQLVSDDYFGSRAHGVSQPGGVSNEIWIMDFEGIFRYISGSPGQLEEAEHDALQDQWQITTGSFDGTGRMTAVMTGTQALRVADDGSLEALPLSIPDFSGYRSFAVDFDGDGLDDVLSLEEGVVWMENISDQ